ncbi:MAG: lysophospholipid acyltransferase family protein [Bdellovibrionales bacterium]
MIFTIVFYVSNIVMCIGIFWLPLVPHRAAVKSLQLFFRFFGVLERNILGLHYVVEGRENLPPGCCIIAIKHQSVWETYKVHVMFDNPVTVMKAELKYVPLWGWYAQKVRSIFVERGKSRAVKSLVEGGLRAKKDGQAIVIFPQGTRVPYGETRPYKRGAIELYTALNVPLVPVALNSGKFWPRHQFIKKPGTITVQILPPIMPGLTGEEAFKKLQDAIETASSKL